MAVLMTAQLPGGTKEMIDGMFAQLAGPQRNAQGFVLHANGPVARGWRVTEVWDSQATLKRGLRATSSQRFPRVPRCRRSRLMS
jgi:hypothetical protein